MYLFDTDILSNAVKPRPLESLINRLSRIPQALQFTTSINVAEIYYGAHRIGPCDDLIRAYEEKVFPRLNILPFDVESAKIFGRLKASLEKRGHMRSEPDLQIAAIALQCRLILVTGNDKHFRDIPRLKVENWIRH